MKYYKVTVKCGHAKMNYYISKSFYIRANDGREAASRARKIPRVKHDQKYAILSVKKITKDEYLIGLRVNEKDPYLRVKNVQEQKILCPNIDELKIKEEKINITYKKFQVKRHLVENARIKEWQKEKNSVIEL